MVINKHETQRPGSTESNGKKSAKTRTRSGTICNETKIKMGKAFGENGGVTDGPKESQKRKLEKVTN